MSNGLNFFWGRDIAQALALAEFEGWKRANPKPVDKPQKRM